MTAIQLSDAIGQIIDTLHTRSEQGGDARLRADALALFTETALLKATESSQGQDRLARLITQAGSATMKRWLETIRRSAKVPVDAVRHGCEANRFVATEREHHTLNEALAPARSALEKQAKAAAMGYLNAIEARRLKAWRAMEVPFLGATDGPIDEFEKQRERWLGANPRLDPRTRPLQIATAELDLCKVSFSLNLRRSDITPIEVALTMCWHAERGAWFPCRPLTRATKGAMVRP